MKIDAPRPTDAPDGDGNEDSSPAEETEVQAMRSSSRVGLQFRGHRLVWAACLLLGVGPAHAQENVASLTMQSGQESNPHTSDEDVEAGARVFRTSCALCHGAEGKGGLGPDLTRGVFRHGSSDRALFRNVLVGISGTDMTGVYRPDTEIWQVVSYVRSLSASAEEVELPGNAARGARIYRSRGGCSDCHRIGGRGGRLGPDLSDIGWMRSPPHLEAALRSPSAVIRPNYRAVRIVTKGGSTLQGLLRNEDTYSIQILDENENLRAFMKADLESIEKPEESLMPAFDGFFTSREIQDLVAYLYSLRK